MDKIFPYALGAAARFMQDSRSVNHPQLSSYVQAMDSVASSYGVALIQQYAYIQDVSGCCDHMQNGFYPDAHLDSLKAQQDLAVIAPLVQAQIGEKT